MASSGDDLVAIGTAASPIEGAMIREYLASHGIDCTVQGEHHRSMLQMVGAYIELRLLVPRSQAEEAAALVRDFRMPSSEAPAEGEDQVDEGEDADGDEAEDADGDEGEDADGEELEDWRESSDLRRKLRAARMVSLFIPGLGLAHFSVGARLRGLVLAASWPATVWLLLSGVGGPVVAAALVPFSTALDLIGASSALADVRRRQRRRERLPRARAIPPRQRGGDQGHHSS